MKKTGAYLREKYEFKYPLNQEKGQGDVSFDQILYAAWRHPDAVLALERYCRGYTATLSEAERTALIVDGLLGFDNSVHPAVREKLLGIIPPKKRTFNNPRK